MTILVSCVAENRPAWLDRVESLVLSLRAFGGSLADAELVVNVVGGIDGGRAARLVELGARVRVVERVDEHNPFANKLRMLELAGEFEFGALLALDCDVAIAADPSAHIREESIGVKPADVDPLAERHWRRLFNALGIDARAKLVVASTSGRPMYPYFNSGVLSVPHALCADLEQAWSARHGELGALLRRDRFLIPPPAHFFLDQLALAAALDALPWHELPVGLNFPTHLPVGRAVLAASPAPTILHYHGEIDEAGFLLRPRCPAAEAAVERVNARRAEALGLSYEGACARSSFERVCKSTERRLRRAATARRLYHTEPVRSLRKLFSVSAR